jgi:tripartite-type tricarboxylate transporter receptor subunit TctC
MAKRMIGVLLAAGLFAPAVQAEDFYRAKTVRLVVASDAGGGYDSYARLFAARLKDHIPGEPTVVVQNMPGAGGIAATSWLYNIAPRDGTVIGLSQRGVPLYPYFGKEQAKYDPAAFNWIGSLNDETGALVVWRKDKVRTFADTLKETIVMGASGPNESESYPALMNNTIGTKFRIVTGYPSTTAVHLAIERGEVEGVSQSWGSLRTDKADWMNNDRVDVLVQIGRTKHPDLGAVPRITEFVKTPEHKMMWQVMETVNAMGRPFAAPPEVPADRVAILRAAFDATIADPAFKADMARTKRELLPVSGEAMQKLIGEVAAMPRAVVGQIDKLTQPSAAMSGLK